MIHRKYWGIILPWSMHAQYQLFEQLELQRQCHIPTRFSYIITWLRQVTTTIMLTSTSKSIPQILTLPSERTSKFAVLWLWRNWIRSSPLTSNQLKKIERDNYYKLQNIDTITSINVARIFWESKNNKESSLTMFLAFINSLTYLSFYTKHQICFLLLD